MLATAASQQRPASTPSSETHPPEALNGGGGEHAVSSNEDGDHSACGTPCPTCSTCLWCGDCDCGAAHLAGTPADPIRTAIESADALLAPFAISWVEPDTRDTVRVTYRDESGRHTAMVDVAGDDPEIYGITVGLHGIESSYALDLTGDRWHEVLAAAEVVRGGGRWVETPSLDAVNAEIVVAHAEVML